MAEETKLNGNGNGNWRTVVKNVVQGLILVGIVGTINFVIKINEKVGTINEDAIRRASQQERIGEDVKEMMESIKSIRENDFPDLKERVIILELKQK